MFEFFRKINGRLSTFIVGLALAISVGLTYGMTQEAGVVYFSGVIPWLITGGVLVQAISVGIWVGTTRADIKAIKEKLEATCQDREANRNDIISNKLDIKTNEVLVSSLEKDFDIVKKRQDACSWVGRSPKEFVKKNNGG